MLVRSSFIAGLLFWIPIGFTFLVIKLVIELLNKIGDLLLKLLPEDWWLRAFFETEAFLQELIIAFFVLALAITIIVFTGLMVGNFLGKKLVEIYESILARIPLVNTIYNASRQIVQSILAAEGNSFRKVVLVEYPRKGIYSVGFVTGTSAQEVQEKTSEKTSVVFIPTTPNPTSGFLIAVPESEMTELKMSVEEGIKFIVSLGMVSPTVNPALLKATAKTENLKEG